ncbi:MAG: hypothetical protein WA823_17920, partial [Candidatus Acidiferrales bacterium]
ATFVEVLFRILRGLRRIERRRDISSRHRGNLKLRRNSSQRTESNNAIEPGAGSLECGREAKP